MPQRPYILPSMVADRYVYNRVVRETEDTVVYGAAQRDIQRDVLVETLRPECMGSPAKVQAFLETARLQAAGEDPAMSCPLELFFADGMWHFARERIQGESLESLRLAGRKLASDAVCELMIRLCRSCLYMDVLGVGNRPFSPGDIYAAGGSFRYDNLMVAGRRPPSASRLFLSQAAEALPPLVDAASPLADRVLLLLDSIRHASSWSRLEPIFLDEKLVALLSEIMHRQPTD